MSLRATLTGSILALALTACQTSLTGSGSTIGSVQAATAELCRFVPAAEAVAGILAAAQPGLVAAAQVAKAVCAAVTPIPDAAGRRSAPASPVVAGVPITGYFVR